MPRYRALRPRNGSYSLVFRVFLDYRSLETKHESVPLSGSLARNVGRGLPDLCSYHPSHLGNLVLCESCCGGRDGDSIAQTYTLSIHQSFCLLVCVSLTTPQSASAMVVCWALGDSQEKLAMTSSLCIWDALPLPAPTPFSLNVVFGSVCTVTPFAVCVRRSLDSIQSRPFLSIRFPVTPSLHS